MNLYDKPPRPLNCWWCDRPNPPPDCCADFPAVFDPKRGELVTVLFGPDEIDDGRNEERARYAPLDPARAYPRGPSVLEISGERQPHRARG